MILNLSLSLKLKSSDEIALFYSISLLANIGAFFGGTQQNWNRKKMMLGLSNHFE